MKQMGEDPLRQAGQFFFKWCFLPICLCASLIALNWKEHEAELYTKKLLMPISTKVLQKMYEAAFVVRQIEKELACQRQTVVSSLLPGETLYTYTHCPLKGVRDRKQRYHYYYHAHRLGEHGHFHLFAVIPLIQEGQTILQTQHLIAVSMNDHGIPQKLFTLNPWVCRESVVESKILLDKVVAFQVEGEESFARTSAYLEALLILFTPQIESLLRIREKALQTNPQIIYDKQIETLSELPISVEGQMRSIRSELNRRRRKMA